MAATRGRGYLVENRRQSLAVSQPTLQRVYATMLLKDLTDD